MNLIKKDMKNSIFKFLREPFILFFLFGLILFMVYEWGTTYYEIQNKKIIVTEAQIQLLKETFTKTWNREPTKQELETQIENLIKDEIYYKEAVALGLDRSDIGVKRRLRQIMEMMMDDMATVYPSEDQLKNYLAENLDKFRQDPLISFRHIYFSSENRDAALEVLGKLKDTLPVDEGSFDGLALIPSEFSEESYRSVERLFGKSFTEQVFALESRIWQGPVESAYGYHLVYISHLTQGFVPELSEIWDEVEREWSVERKMEIKDQQYQKIRENYTISFVENE
jgi:parvulin-like peptidyl-prolyl isomerase